ncbi:hypothetical protein L1285_20755 [Pseudoalteromonas sp. DL2-H2.2]|uniref:hypothetical protein n=1 Tax=Pseudoalteromonas sp. DL2-H2.2 TaxID=2908889 RepID=UPI001F316617|nr:hypothetical protein [Pseudoalteromonas sp. DL2-H2.2]MCF2910741.1 hypothetical protein [Pseudoalteromonas sp. DL2-H2.2]
MTKQATESASDCEQQTMRLSAWTQLIEECHAMMAFAFRKGLQVPEGTVVMLHQLEWTDKNAAGARDLARVHNRLAELVSPAKPETIWLMAEESHKGSWLLFLGRVKLIRKMMLVAITSLIALIALSLSSYINNENMVASMFDMEGTRLLYVQAILLAAAAIGASFSALFKANTYVTAGCYDPKYESSYWVRFVVGLIAGIILTQLIPIDLQAVADATAAQNRSSEVSQAALRITMALVGGFSANLVYKILDRVVETVQSFIAPPTSPAPDNNLQAQAMHTRMQSLEQLNSVSLAVMAIQQKLVSNPSITAEQMQLMLSELIRALNAHQHTDQ